MGMDPRPRSPRALRKSAALPYFARENNHTTRKWPSNLSWLGNTRVRRLWEERANESRNNEYRDSDYADSKRDLAMGLSTRTQRQLAERSRLLSWVPGIGATNTSPTKVSPEVPGTNTNRATPHVARVYLLFLMQRLGKGSFLDRLRGVATLSRKQLDRVEPEWQAYLANQGKRSA